MCGVDPLPEDEVVEDEDLFALPKHAEKNPFVEVTHKMKMNTEELSILPGNRSKLPSMIWLEVKSFFNEKYNGNWYGLQEHQVLEMVRKCRNKLGQGNSISTLENVMDYSKMPSKDRPFLHHSMCSPHPDKSDVMMCLMIFANPALLGLLNGVVDLFIDATFSCVPAPFYQCLIIMVFDPSTSHYLPVVYALMTHKVQELYWQMFNQLIFLTKWKMQVRTFTSGFELAMMNMLELRFEKNAGGGKHVGCFFHLKQAWRKYLIEKCGLGLLSLLGPLMAVGGLNLLYVIPLNGIDSVGIPFLYLTLEGTATELVKILLDKFWTYFRKQWLRITNKWNIREEDGHFLQMVNRTNNALESYNCRFNSIFLKSPSLIEFNELVKNESLRQENILNVIHAGRHREKDHPEVWIPEIPVSYYEFKREQQYTEDLEMSYAATDPEESSNDDIPINRKIAKPRSKIKKEARIVHVKSKRAKTVSVAKSIKMKPPTKRPAAEQPAKRPATEPLGNVSNSIGGHPKHITKKPKKSLP